MQRFAGMKKPPKPEDIAAAEKKRESSRRISANAEFSKLTTKRRALVKIILENPTMSFTEAARRAGYKVGPNSKLSVVKREIAGKLSLTLREFGIYEGDLAKVAVDALKAVKCTIVKRRTYDQRGRLKDEFYDVIETPDHSTRLAAFKQLSLLGDYFPAKKVKVSGEINHRPFSDVRPEILEQRAKELKERSDNAVEADYTIEPDEGRAG
jgi:hypothetical protein